MRYCLYDHVSIAWTSYRDGPSLEILSSKDKANRDLITFGPVNTQLM